MAESDINTGYGFKIIIISQGPKVVRKFQLACKFGAAAEVDLRASLPVAFLQLLQRCDCAPLFCTALLKRAGDVQLNRIPHISLSIHYGN